MKTVHPMNSGKISHREPDWVAIRRLLARPIEKCCASEPPCELCPSALHSSSKDTPVSVSACKERPEA